LPQGGLEIPCIFKFQGNEQLIDKSKKLQAISKKCIEKEGTTEKVDLPLSSNYPEAKQIKMEEKSPSIPGAKRIKVEEMLPSVPEAKQIKVEELEDEQIVSVAFSGTTKQLYCEDKMMIEEQRRLNDRHINFAQALLRSQFPQCDGLRNTLLQHRVEFSVKNKTVQILHTRSDHWVVIFNVYYSGTELSLYDTIYNDIDDSTMALIRSLFKEVVTVIVAQVQKQQGHVDSRVFSVATATSLLHGLFPGPYVQALLRLHIIQCIEKK